LPLWGKKSRKFLCGRKNIFHNFHYNLKCLLLKSTSGGGIRPVNVSKTKKEMKHWMLPKRTCCPVLMNLVAILAGWE
jgi:hypothetical protein